jgi:hypothetical protein
VIADHLKDPKSYLSSLPTELVDKVVKYIYHSVPITEDIQKQANQLGFFKTKDYSPKGTMCFAVN